MPSFLGPLGNSYVKEVRIGFYEIPTYLKNPNQQQTLKKTTKISPNNTFLTDLQFIRNLLFSSANNTRLGKDH